MRSLLGPLRQLTVHRLPPANGGLGQKCRRPLHLQLRSMVPQIHLWRFSDAGPCRTSPQPPGPVSENPRGTNARGAGRPELHNAMRISPPPPACERLAAMLERRAGLGSYVRHWLQRRETGACAAARGLPGARLAAVAILPGERGRGRHAGGGADGRPLEWKRLR